MNLAANWTGCRSVKTRAQGEQLGEIALDRQVSVEEGRADGSQVEGAERLEPDVGADHQGRFRLAAADDALAAVWQPDPKSGRGARPVVLAAHLLDGAVGCRQDHRAS